MIGINFNSSDKYQLNVKSEIEKSVFQENTFYVFFHIKAHFLQIKKTVKGKNLNFSYMNGKNREMNGKKKRIKGGKKEKTKKTKRKRKGKKEKKKKDGDRHSYQ